MCYYYSIKYNFVYGQLIIQTYFIITTSYGEPYMQTGEHLYKRIDFTKVPGIKIGNATDKLGQTGLTVFLFDKPAKTGLSISGGGPASRETPVLDPTKENLGIHAILLSGGSAFGLAASTGVMQFLEEEGIGFDTGYAKVPLVVQSCIYDLAYGKASHRPSAQMGYEACLAAYNKSNPQSGLIGGGRGACVGKLAGMARASKSGIGYYAIQLGKLIVGAAVVLNAYGDIFNYKTGEKIAGTMDVSRTNFINGLDPFYEKVLPHDLFANHKKATHNKQNNTVEEKSPISSRDIYKTNKEDITVPNKVHRTNTTIGCIFTNGDFDKAELSRIARQAENGYARCINPVSTLADGDTIYASSCGNLIEADCNVVGTLAAEVMGFAIMDAIKHSHVSNEEFLANV